jgi:hypothetical protein
MLVDWEVKAMARVTNDLRFNITANDAEIAQTMSHFGGAMPFPLYDMPGFSERAKPMRFADVKTTTLSSSDTTTVAHLARALARRNNCRR